MHLLLLVDQRCGILVVVVVTAGASTVSQTVAETLLLAVSQRLVAVAVQRLVAVAVVQRLVAVVVAQRLVVVAVAAVAQSLLPVPGSRGSCS